MDVIVTNRYFLRILRRGPGTIHHIVVGLLHKGAFTGGNDGGVFAGDRCADRGRR